jgi:hypothetical protein
MKLQAYLTTALIMTIEYFVVLAYSGNLPPVHKYQLFLELNWVKNLFLPKVSESFRVGIYKNNVRTFYDNLSC